MIPTYTYEEYKASQKPLLKASVPQENIQDIIQKILNQQEERIKKEYTEYGFLFFFHGKKIASIYTKGNQDYFTLYFKKINLIIYDYIYTRNIGKTKLVIFLKEMMKWVHHNAKQGMHVSLNTNKNFAELVVLQEVKLQKQRYILLDSLVKNLILSINNSLLMPSHASPSFIKKNELDIKNLDYICYEVFVHAVEYSKEDLFMYASGIVAQLQSDYIHNPLHLTTRELSYLFHVIYTLKSDFLIHNEKTELSIFKDETVQVLLQHYCTHDSLHNLLANYVPHDKEREERLLWQKKLNLKQFPFKIQKAIIKGIFSFNELHVLLSSLNLEPLSVRVSQNRDFIMHYDGYFSFFIRTLLECGGNIKHIVKAYTVFTLPSAYLQAYDIGKSKHIYSLNESLLHDFYEVLFPIVLTLFKTLNTAEFSKKNRHKLSNIFLKSMLTYNLHSSKNINHLALILRNIKYYLDKGGLSHEYVLKNINQKSSLTKIISLASQADMMTKQKSLDKIMLEINTNLEKQNHLNWDYINMSASMLVQNQYLSLYKHVLAPTYKQTFFQTSLAKEVKKEYIRYKIGIYTHQSPLGVLGAGVNGVCITLDSTYRLEQLHPAFMNLCLYSDEKILLWGLLCRATKNDKTIYILNNFQGSINSKKISKYEVRNQIIQTLKDFVKENNLEAVLIKNQYFNAINLCDGLSRFSPDKEPYKLTCTTRLDFNISNGGTLGENDFFLIQ